MCKQDCLLKRCSTPNAPQVFDLYSPRWECLEEGAWAGGIPWLRPHGTYTAFYGNRQYTLKPDAHEKLWELQACCPEEAQSTVVWWWQYSLFGFLQSWDTWCWSIIYLPTSTFALQGE
jgi:hypothetical protein